MRIEKVFVLGAGAIGSLYGALLSKGKDVTLVGNKAHVEAIRGRGLQLIGEINQTFNVNADTKIREIPPHTLILLTTKAQDSAKAVNQIKRSLKRDTIILVLQNGLGNEEKVKELVNNKVQVLRGLTTMAAEFLEPGKIRVWKGETVIGDSETASEIASLFNSCGLETRVSKKMEGEVWKKLVLNCIVNPLTAIFHVRNNKIVSENLRWIRREVARECIEVAKAEGVNLEIETEELDRKILSYTNLSSMCQDILKKKRTEIDFLNGKIVELGRKHGIQTPVNQTLTCLVKFLEENQGEI